MAAAERNDLEMGKRHLAAGDDVNGTDSEKKDTPLHVAAISGNVEFIKLLLSYKAQIEARDTAGYTPLGFAVLVNQLESVKALADAGAAINIRVGGKELDTTPLHIAASKGYLDILKILLDHGADVNVVAGWNRQWTPLQAAAYNGQAEVAEVLLAKGADINARHAETGWTPLHFAAQSNSPKVVRILAQHGADVESKDLKGNTAIIYCATAEMVSALVSVGAKLHDEGPAGLPEVKPLAGSPPRVLDDKDLPVHEDHTYTLHIDADASMKLGPMPEQAITSTAISRYRRDQQKTKVALYEISDYLKLYTNGELQRESSSDALGMKKKTPHETRAIVYKETARPEFLEYIKERYSTPFCTLTVDGDGHALKQDIRKSEHPEIEVGMAASYQLFHGRFCPTDNKWEEEASFQGTTPVKGVLSYVKQPPGKEPTLVHVQVSGTMTTMIPMEGNDLTISNLVTGEQTYDTQMKQWVSGKLELKASSTQAPDATVKGSVTGTMTLSMEMEGREK
jgi:hypothetical protein